MRILALVPGGIGDQILFFPTLETLKTQYPKATIDVIVEPRAKAAYRVCPIVHEVLAFDYRDRNGLADYLNLLGIIRDREYDIALSLGQRWTIEMLLWLNGIPLRVGYQSSTAWFLSNPVPLKSSQYTPEIFHDILTGLRIQNPCPPVKIALPKEDIDWAEAEQKRLDLKETGYILIYPFQSPNPKNSYPVGLWQKVIANIQAKQPNLPIVLLQDANNVEKVALMLENTPNLKVTEPGDVGKFAAMIAAANLMLCTDNEALPVAIAVGTYTIALFGPTDPTQSIPPGSDRYLGIQSTSDNVADIDPETILQKMWQK
ncbi:glycosyl transferase family 9 [Rippkaea orientalis PCC 8801]|uniref:Glycosyl transferase family 9 n=1 Tax=Rippkaea orientalis (strain PCC 8801 / RF-1) TaxID=41431 RepID=B7JWR0_RIPO1|nr:glycosyltransferase family 9 protein [Rippkaea orientalis]ACK64706.1 glycosyl transferase family 9 [Rippkaea orientalis PCC 8801]